MSLRKLATLSTMTALLMISFAVLAGCDDNEVQKAHLPPNIGTDPASGGQAPTVNVGGTGTGGASAGSTGGGGGAPQQFQLCSGRTVPVARPSTIVVDCSDFGCQAEAQRYHDLLVAAFGVDALGRDVQFLDGDGDGQACNALGIPFAACANCQ